MENISDPRIKEICKEHNLDVMILFGSKVTGITHPESDTDIAIKAASELSLPELLSLGAKLDKIFGDTDVVDMNTAPPLLLGAITHNGKVLYESTPGLGVTARVWGMNQYLDYEPYLRRMRQGI